MKVLAIFGKWPDQLMHNYHEDKIILKTYLGTCLNENTIYVSLKTWREAKAKYGQRYLKTCLNIVKAKLG